MPKPKKVIVRTYARPELVARFHEQFPGTGSLAWLLERAMIEVLTLTDGQPPLKELVRSAIKSAVLRERINNRKADATSPAATDATDVTSELTVERIDRHPA